MDSGDRNNNWTGHRYLIHEVVPEHRAPVDDLDGDAAAGLGIDGEPDLGEGALADGPADPVLANALRQHHLPRPSPAPLCTKQSSKP